MLPLGTDVTDKYNPTFRRILGNGGWHRISFQELLIEATETQSRFGVANDYYQPKFFRPRSNLSQCIGVLKRYIIGHQKLRACFQHAVVSQGILALHEPMRHRSGLRYSWTTNLAERKEDNSYARCLLILAVLTFQATDLVPPP
jgi:hypothetical protein